MLFFAPGCDLAGSGGEDTNETLIRQYLSGSFSGNASQGWSIFVYDNVRDSFLTPPSITQGTNFLIDITAVASNQDIYYYAFTDRNNNTRFDYGAESYFYIGWMTKPTGLTNTLGLVPISSRAVTVTVDDRNNSNAQIYLFGTFHSTNRGYFYQNNFNDVVETAYPMYDDGTHGDTTADDHIWSLPLDLIYGRFRYTVKMKATPTAGNYRGVTSIELHINTNLSSVYYVMPSEYLRQDVQVLFQVVTTNVTGFSSINLRGAVSPLSWSTNIRLYDDGTHGDLVSNDRIYSRFLTFTSNSASLVEYKYVFNLDDWEFGGNRSMVIDSGTNTNILSVDKF